MCARCVTEFWKDDLGDCIECTGGEHGEAVITLGLIAGGALACVALWGYFKVARHRQYNELLVRARKTVNRVFDMSKFKVIWSTYQIITSIHWVLDITWEPPFESFMRGLRWIFDQPLGFLSGPLSFTV